MTKAALLALLCGAGHALQQAPAVKEAAAGGSGLAAQLRGGGQQKSGEMGPLEKALNEYDPFIMVADAGLIKLPANKDPAWGREIAHGIVGGAVSKGDFHAGGVAGLGATPSKAFSAGAVSYQGLKSEDKPPSGLQVGKGWFTAKEFGGSVGRPKEGGGFDWKDYHAKFEPGDVGKLLGSLGLPGAQQTSKATEDVVPAAQ
mmetsp:Transcript_106082/g.299949  ORF Transcript_106082/g.299949 Transcript_106082/m.299949 type:complete len:201 (+) Transcript_106082:83-685(+)